MRIGPLKAFETNTPDRVGMDWRCSSSLHSEAVIWFAPAYVERGIPDPDEIMRRLSERKWEIESARAVGRDIERIQSAKANRRGHQSRLS